MPAVALFVPCYIDQFYPNVAIAALRVLERLGVDVAVPGAAVCCGQPPANAGFERSATRTLDTFVDAFASFEQIIVLSGSCAMHIRTHASGHGAHGAMGAHVAARTTEFCSYLHDVIGIDRVSSLGSSFTSHVGVHIGCHGLRGMGLAAPSELQVPGFNKVRALLETVQGITFADVKRPDECCGFGGTFAMAESAISTKMGHDRLRDYASGNTQVLVSTDMSCLMHLDGLARRAGISLPMLHVAQLLAGAAE